MRYTVFTGHKCPWCVKVIKYLASHGYEFDVVAIKGNEDALNFLAKKGLTTVPQVFMGDKHIGGFEATVAHFNKQEKEPNNEA